jgi:ABC-type transport system substrate-binding protein
MKRKPKNIDGRIMQMKKLTLLFFALVMTVSFCACGSLTTGTPSTAPASTASSDSASSGDNASPTASGRYPKVTVAIAADPAHLKPTNGNGYPTGRVYCEIYEALFDYDNQGNLVPSIGKSITIKDEKHYDVAIYDCVYDSAGNKITADDVVYSIKWLIKEGEAFKYELFQDVVKVDDYTVEFVSVSYTHLTLPTN